MNHISATSGAALFPYENYAGRIARAPKEDEQAAARQQENDDDRSALQQDRNTKAVEKSAPESARSPLKGETNAKQSDGAALSTKAIAQENPFLPLFAQYEPPAKQTNPLDLYGARTKESTLHKSIRADAIARKIAGGKYVSAQDRQFLEANDPGKARKAKLANQQRIMTETNVAGVKNKAVVKQILQNAKTAASVDSGGDAGALVKEGIAELEERYLRKKNPHGGGQSALRAANYYASLMKTPTSRFNMLA